MHNKEPEKKTAVGNLNRQILRQLTRLQNTKAAPSCRGRGVKQVPIAQLWQALDAYHNCFDQKRKASQMTDDAAGPAAPPPLVASVPSTEAPSSCDPDLPSCCVLEDEYLLSPTTSHCFQMIEP
ncbi:hypothetical protein FNYG_05462 [Fusarium nygamai]|uniref:Uncharacterized protein n=1 Tax=Gibberella nygamai TaxID=42673 RepID=A0A2K0WFE1_GIBNY|nr:hypothetical protein FNYG_05462 [Fusarium nygamai]